MVSGFPWLSFLTFFPIVTGLGTLLSKDAGNARKIAFTAALLELGITLAIWFSFPADGKLHFQERYVWAPDLGIEYFSGIDGIGLCFLLVTAIVFPMTLLASSRDAAGASPRFYALVLILQGGLAGTFTALNFVHWFFFWELSLIPAFFLIRASGGNERSSASIQFFIYTMVGSIAMLLGFLALHAATGTFDMVKLGEAGRNGTLPTALASLNMPGLSAAAAGTLVFTLVLLGFAVKMPIVPLHGWLLPAYTQAATPVTMLLTGAMSKMGVYGLVRVILPVFGEQVARFQNALLALAVLTILYGAFAALAQTDLKRLLGCASLSHVGYCALGAFAAGSPSDSAFESRAAAMNGALLQVVSHGVIAAGLFGSLAFLEQRARSTSLEHFGGLRRNAPAASGLIGLLIFASIGLPGLSSFAAEFLIFSGSFASSRAAAAFAVPSLLVTAVFLLRMFNGVFHGPLNPRLANAPDLTAGEALCLAPAIAIALALGIFPALLASLTAPAVHRLFSS